MDKIDDYLRRTESAVRKLFDGIQEYIALIPRNPSFCRAFSDQDDIWKQYEEWHKEHEAEFEAVKAAEKMYFAESFAQATLCGSVLQVAAKAIECYSSNDSVPSDIDFLGSSEARKYCIGRRVWTVPIGLIVYAGRNQHMHYEEQSLSKINKSVFNRLALNHGIGGAASMRHPAFDLENKGNLPSFANNITAILNWRTYEQYEQDLRSMLS